MRIPQHPVLDFERGRAISFTFDGKRIDAFDNETIAVALHAAGVQRLSHSFVVGHPRGFFCAIGNCAACNMIVDGESNVRTCVTLARNGMVVQTQTGKGGLA